MKKTLSILVLTFLAVGGGLKASPSQEYSKSGAFLGIEGNLNFASLFMK